jgi:hypothetical protein
MDRVVAGRFELLGNPQQRLSINEEPHAAPSGTT